MTFHDFCTTFAHVVVCRLMRDKYYADISSEWGDPHKAGGSIDHKATFLSNPQVPTTCDLHLSHSPPPISSFTLSVFVLFLFHSGTSHTTTRHPLYIYSFPFDLIPFQLPASLSHSLPDFAPSPSFPFCLF